MKQFARIDQRPHSLEEIKTAIVKGRLVFPRAMERVAREAIEKPETIAFESAAVIARRCKVGHTTVARLPAYLGFDNFKDMKRFFQHVLVEERGAGRPLRISTN